MRPRCGVVQASQACPSRPRLGAWVGRRDEGIPWGSMRSWADELSRRHGPPLTASRSRTPPGRSSSAPGSSTGKAQRREERWEAPPTSSSPPRILAASRKTCPNRLKAPHPLRGSSSQRAPWRVNRKQDALCASAGLSEQERLRAETRGRTCTPHGRKQHTNPRSETIRHGAMHEPMLFACTTNEAGKEQRVNGPCSPGRCVHAIGKTTTDIMQCDRHDATSWPT